MERRGLVFALGIAIAIAVWLYVRDSREVPLVGGADDGAAEIEDSAPGLAAGARKTNTVDPASLVDAANEREPVVRGVDGRFGILFSATADKPEHPVVSMFSSGGLEIGPPAPGYPVRVFWQAPEPIEAPVLTGVTGEDGKCRLAPLIIPSVPYHLRNAVRLVVEGGGGAWSKIAFQLEPWKVFNEAGEPKSDGAGTVPTRWYPIGWGDWRGAPVSGRVVTTEGEPVSGLSVAEPKFGSMTRTDETGAFTLRCPVGDVDIFGDTYGRYYMRLPLREGEPFPPVPLASVFVPEEGLSGLRLELPERTRVRGRVRLADGLPARGVGVALRVLDKSASQNVTTDAEGRFDFVGLRRDRLYELLIENEDGLYPDGTEVEPGDEDLAFEIKRHMLRVVLVDEHSGQEIQGTTTITDGSRAPGAKVHVRSWAKGYGVVEQPYVMKKEPYLQELRVTMRRVASDGALRVRCVGLDGMRVVNAPIHVWAPDSYFGLPVNWRDEDGFRVTRDIGPGRVAVGTGEPAYGQTRLGAPGAGNARFLVHESRTVQIPAKGVLDVELRPPVGGALAFNVTIDDRSKQLAVLQEPTLTNEAGEEFEVLLFRRNGEFWNNARWLDHAHESSALPAGVYRLQLKGSWHKPIERVIRVEKERLTPVEFTVEARDD